MNRQFIAKHWYASVYEQFETQTDDVDFLLKVLREHLTSSGSGGNGSDGSGSSNNGSGGSNNGSGGSGSNDSGSSGGSPLNILEAACGGGRICVPLAQALTGCNITGFDADEHMLLRCYNKMRGIPNIRCYQADALESGVGCGGGCKGGCRGGSGSGCECGRSCGWDADYDIVIMAGNVLINIESEKYMDYAEAQQIFIRKAAATLRSGGHLYLDYDQHSDASAREMFNGLGEHSYFSGVDDLGTSGRTVSWGGAYDPVTRIWSGIGHWEIVANNGERFIYAEKPRYKHIPPLGQVYGWLDAAGLTVEKTYRNFTSEPLSEHEEGCVRATIWAKKQ